VFRTRACDQAPPIKQSFTAKQGKKKKQKGAKMGGGNQTRRFKEQATSK
jgi:hypothetical protein